MQTRIKELRKILNLTQGEFAKRLDIDASTVSVWERNGKIPRVKLMNICKTFGVSVKWIETGEGEIFTQTKEDSVETIQDRFRRFRKLLGYTQKELADILGMTDVSISLWERDGNIPPNKQMLLSQTFGLNPDWLTTGAGEMFCGNATASIPPREYALQNGCDEVTATLFERFMALPENEKKAFARILTQIVSGNGSASSLETDATIDNINGSIVLKGTVNSRDITVNNFPKKK